MTFTSNKSMEIEVFVDADPFVDESRERYRAVSAFFTYVSLSKEGKPLPVPQLLVRAPPAGPRAGRASPASPSPTPPGADPGWLFSPANPLPLNYSAEKYEHEQAFPEQALGLFFFKFLLKIRDFLPRCG